jgi:serine protease AprX
MRLLLVLSFLISLAASADGLVAELHVEKTVPTIHPFLAATVASNPETHVTVWVFFTDKGVFGESEYEFSRVRAISAMSHRALERRATAGVDGLADWYDLPVSDSYVDAVESHAIRVRGFSRWLNAASVEARAGALEGIGALPFVREVRPVATYTGSFPRGKSVPTGPSGADWVLDYGPSEAQLVQINVPPLHDLGHSGLGVVVAMLDTGYRKDHDAFANIIASYRLLDEWDFINNDGNTQNETGDPSGQHYHGTLTWSALGGESSGDLYGPAYGASFLIYKTEDVSHEVRAEEDYYVFALERADSMGAHVASSSLGYVYFDSGFTYIYPQDFNGDYAVTTVAVDIAASRGIVVTTAMGNSGPSSGTLITPADADSCVSIGAVNSSGDVVSFSSRGPTGDGRIKPEVCARGLSTVCADPSGTSWYGTASGTSLSTPLAGGAAALLRGIHPEWSAIDTREAMMRTASNAATPDNDYGWGIINAVAANDYNPLTIAHAPLPDQSDTLSAYPVGATITSTPGVADTSVVVAYNTTGAPPFTEISMTRAAGDTFTADIPAASGGSVVYYYLRAGNVYENRHVLPQGAPDVLYSFDVVTGVEDAAAELPVSFGVLSIAPNPFNPTASVTFSLDAPARARLDVLDVLGRRIRTLVDAAYPSGVHSVVWDGRDSGGSPVASGTYFARLIADGRSDARRMVLLK